MSAKFLVKLRMFTSPQIERDKNIKWNGLCSTRICSSQQINQACIGSSQVDSYLCDGKEIYATGCI